MPEIKVNPDFNPFNDEDSYQRDKISFDRSGKPDRSNLRNWEKLYTDFNQGKEPAPPVESSETTEAHIRQILQLKNKYIVCPVKSGLMLIDQKRAHERVLFEKFLGALRDNSCISQLTLFPKTIELSQGDMAILTEIEDDLLNCGFEIQYLGKSAISINAYPADSKNDDPYEMLEILLEGYRSKEKLPGDDRKEKLAAAMARAAAIPYGRPLQNAEISELFDSLFMTTNPNYSPHGKPIVSIITIEELEKRLR
jgi:DNA mismatch repair protein MutL